MKRQPPHRVWAGPTVQDGAAPDGAVEALEETECRRLLTTLAVGRLVSTEGALPSVLLVPFVLRGGEVVVRAGEPLCRAAGHGAVLAFEADDHSPRSASWWMVTTVGASRLVTDPTEVADLDALALPSWTPAGRGCYLGIAVDLVRGHRVGALQGAAAPRSDGAVR